jgi:hypothetical protein
MSEFIRDLGQYSGITYKVTHDADGVWGIERRWMYRDRGVRGGNAYTGYDNTYDWEVLPEMYGSQEAAARALAAIKAKDADSKPKHLSISHPFPGACFDTRDAPFHAHLKGSKT